MTNELQTVLDEIKQDKDTNLLPENLKAGVTCLGVNGTFDGGGSTEGVKLFDTAENMQKDTTAKEKDLAIVYKNGIQEAKVDSIFRKARFPKKVILDTALTSSVNVTYKAVDNSTFNCSSTLNSREFTMTCYMSNGSISIEYSSPDGLTYTRTVLEGEGVSRDTADFGIEIQYANPEQWNDVIGKFIQTGDMLFDGLYECNFVTDTDSIVFLSKNEVTQPFIPSEVYDKTSNDKYDKKKIISLLKKINSEDYNNDSGFKISLYLKNNELNGLVVTRTYNDRLIFDKTNIGLNNNTFMMEDFLMTYGMLGNTTENLNGHGPVYNYVLDINNQTYTKTELAESAYTTMDFKSQYHCLKITTIQPDTYMYVYVLEDEKIQNLRFSVKRFLWICIYIPSSNKS